MGGGGEGNGRGMGAREWGEGGGGGGGNGGVRGRFWSIRQTSLGDRRVSQGNECAQLDRPLRDGAQGNGVE